MVHKDQAPGKRTGDQLRDTIKSQKLCSSSLFTLRYPHSCLLQPVIRNPNLDHVKDARLLPKIYICEPLPRQFLTAGLLSHRIIICTNNMYPFFLRFFLRQLNSKPSFNVNISQFHQNVLLILVPRLRTEMYHRINAFLNQPARLLDKRVIAVILPDFKIKVGRLAVVVFVELDI